ncbi:hypothetical protein J2752_001967 [Halarchaeum rubridurum]|uniref:Uncharacterized protein n=1 Tax=Halarchaeum rubridurum TaxID=489911 RepID=A0A830G0G7_9EURY|nr:hypothetical protein [Halarchaeum rubridurum]MBP1955055.1 hypothetical protein [Halarchaeum rubridurum]GGM69318.1 hypothetical protein GCM10009017_19380 [Halarchaeum rubridurum]
MLYFAWKVLLRPVLPYLLAFAGLVALATAVGDVTGWWDMHAILLDAAYRAIRGAVDAAVAAVQGVIDSILDAIASRLNPL